MLMSSAVALPLSPSSLTPSQKENAVANARSTKPAAVKRPFQDSTNSNSSRDVPTFKRAAAEAATVQVAAARHVDALPQGAPLLEEKADVCSLIDAVDFEFNEVADAAVPRSVVAEAATLVVEEVALQRSTPAVSRSTVCDDVTQRVPEYAPSIYLYMISHEECFRPVAAYLDKHNEVNFKMRRILCDWLHEVHYKFRLLPETFFLMINYVDRYLTEKTEYRPIP
jgi:hypothetical protein